MEDNSAFDNAPGSTIDAAIRNASQIPGPIMSAANAGITKSPEPSIEESEIITTPLRPIVRLKVSVMSLVTPFKSPFRSLEAVSLTYFNPRFMAVNTGYFTVSSTYHIFYLPNFNKIGFEKR